MKNEILLEDALLLVEQNFYFLHVGNFFDRLSKKEDLSSYDLEIKKDLDSAQVYRFNTHIVKELLQDSFGKENSEITLYEYFVDFNSYRGICMAMVEALRLESPFRSFMQVKLADQFENFFDILSFVRNVLSHNIHAQIKLSEKDFAGTLKRIRRMQRDTHISFDLVYSRDLPEIGSPSLDYGFSCSIDFEDLSEDMEFLKIISHWELIMLSELCFNLVTIYRVFSQKEF